MPLPPFQAFVDEHRDHVHRFLVASVGRQDAEDCFQETFVSALRAWPRVRDDGRLRSWILTIAHHKAMDSHRARRRNPVPVEELPEVPVAEPGFDPGDEALWTDVRSLPRKQRAAVLLRFAGDLSHAEIGAAIGCSEEAARRSVHEGLKKLREDRT